MTVDELKTILARVPGELEIKMSIDPEGNGFSTLDDYTVDEWSDFFNEPADEDTPVKMPKKLVLWPR
jgi:hypothetical protein